MQEFIETQGALSLAEKIPIKKTQTHSETFNLTSNKKTETPHESMMKRKEKKTQEKIEKLKEAVRDNSSLIKHHKQRKIEELHGPSKFDNTENDSYFDLKTVMSNNTKTLKEGTNFQILNSKESEVMKIKFIFFEFSL